MLLLWMPLYNFVYSLPCPVSWKYITIVFFFVAISINRNNIQPTLVLLVKCYALRLWICRSWHFMAAELNPHSRIAFPLDACEKEMKLKRRTILHLINYAWCLLMLPLFSRLSSSFSEQRQWLKMTPEWRKQEIFQNAGVNVSRLFR